MVEVRSRRVGGANYQVPVEVRPARVASSLAHALAHPERARPSREVDGAEARRRDPRRGAGPRRRRSRRRKTRTGWPRPTRPSPITAGRRVGTRIHASSRTTRAHSEHRHHGPHRCRQDHDDRAHPLLHRHQPQDRRGARRRRDHGLDGAGAGARHHDHVGRHHVLLARPPRQHHRHARATSTSRSRSSGASACSTARSRCSAASAASSRSPRPCGARRIATRSRASRSSTRWTASAPTSSACVDQIRERLNANPVVLQLPLGAEEKLRGVDRPRQDEGHHLGRRQPGLELSRGRDPGRHGGAPPQAAREKLLEAVADLDESLMEKYLGGEAISEAEIRAALRKGTIAMKIVPVVARQRVQEQGRADAARRRRRLSAVAARHPADARRQPRHRATRRSAPRPTTSRSPRSRSRS